MIRLLSLEWGRVAECRAHRLALGPAVAPQGQFGPRGWPHPACCAPGLH